MRIEFIDDWAAAIADQVAPILNDLVPYAPSWLHRLTVQYRSDLDCNAEITVQQEYRQAALRIAGGAFDNDGKLARILCHEFAHLYTLPMQSVAMKLSIHAFPDGPTPGTRLHDDWVRETCEGATEDLSRVFLALVSRSLSIDTE